MAIVTIESPRLNSDQKVRIGDKILQALSQEGVLASSVVVLFHPERGDMYLDQHLFQTQAEAAAPAPAKSAPAAAAAPAPAEAEASPSYKIKARRTQAELEGIKQDLMGALRQRGSLNSFEAQESLGLKDCDWAPATLRRMFTELEEASLVGKIGQKRGTRYLWTGPADDGASLPPAILVKAETDEA
ncbi:MAG: hypothetical protein WCO20_07360 [Holophagaceae bacterium]|nr:hypothetical protein [Acidobacteriota bacterium]